MIRKVFQAVSAVIADPELRRRLQHGVVWNIAAAVMNQGSTFALMLIVSNVLGRQQFGVYALVQSTVLLFGNAAQVSMGFTVTKFVAESRTSDRPRAARVLAVCGAIGAAAGLVASVVVWAGASFISSRVLEQPEVAPLLRIASPVVFFICVSSVCTGALIGLERYRRLGIVAAAGSLFYITAGALAAIEWSLSGVIAAVAAAYAVQTALLIVAVIRAAHGESLVLGRAVLRELFDDAGFLFTFALPSALTGFTLTLTLWTVNAVLARQPNGAVAVALFTAANTMRTIVLFVPVLFNSVGFSSVNNAWGSGDLVRYRRLFLVNVAGVTTTALAGAAFIALTAPWLLLAFGRNFAEARPALFILMVEAPLEALATSIYVLIQAHRRMWLSFLRIGLPRDALTIAATLLFVPLYGATGAALSFLAGSIAALLSVIVHTGRIVE
jgi:O-antigen/teichoic acid export membrane protein